MDERAFFDNLAPEWDNNEVLSTDEKVNEILDLSDVREGQSILDLGTGTGVLLPHIAGRIGKQGKITAIDYSEGMLTRAQAKFSHLIPVPEFINMDFESETITGEYDRIFLYCVYPHLHTPTETLKWLRAVNLKNEGMIIIAFPSGPDFINNIHRERHSESDILPTASKLAESLAASGLKTEVAAEDEDHYVVRIHK